MNPLSFLSNILLGPVLKTVTNAYDSYLKAGVDKNKLEADVKKAVLSTLQEQTEKQADVIIAEINSKDKLVRRWRPCVALGSFFVLFFYALILPISVDWFGLPTVRTGDLILSWMHSLTTIAIGGYIGGRTLEKIAHTIVTRWR